MPKNDYFSFSLRPSQKLLLNLIRQHTPSRVELSQLSGLTPGAVTQYCRELMFLGLIKEGAKIAGKRGLPSYRLELNPAACCSVGVSFYENHFEASIIDLSGKKLAISGETYNDVDNFEQILLQIKHVVKSMLEKKLLTGARILGVGYAVPGYLLADGSRSSPWLPVLQNKPDLSTIFEAQLGLPAWVENNTNVNAVGEFYSGNWNKIKDMTVISIDYGLGAGIITEGKLTKGGFGNAGEIGAFFPNGEQRPTWKDLKRTLNKENLPLDQLDNLIAIQHPIIEQWLNRVCEQLQLVIQSVLYWLDPEVIVITGLLPPALSKKIITKIKQSPLYQDPPNKPKPLLHCPENYMESISLAAACLPIYHLLN
ncbi:ROK family protein [Testudinibacter sp. TR-2022]|uniref:ROK family protein n=1 Tax=Testudinibacter sp. TR-2022 TaxID=2585029 RepID=UPI00111A0FA6|nr:ROK family protein [Testudinibacter sp. TR-2022]TNH01586.1 ROK family protein [Pasteurellaceae bacterium Phil31]TNH07443.1 ROK family protein [Testudinibacter sp. TR-2022]TNH09279.1 ROK family protein [Testudinibacter sp. TR-2022]TNH12997.1 ROK family protein [Testudinibacter sp. TR-2022]TNH14869.1 ROK family protein [Testudinibacter sp. TR-2022]